VLPCWLPAFARLHSFGYDWKILTTGPMHRFAAFPHLFALCTAASLLLPGAAQAGEVETKAAPTSGTAEYSSVVSEVDSCNQAQYRMPANATATAMRVSSVIKGEYATFTCRLKWSLSPSARPTYRPILFSPSA
jgi:hypothetical protein